MRHEQQGRKTGAVATLCGVLLVSMLTVLSRRLRDRPRARASASRREGKGVSLGGKGLVVTRTEPRREGARHRRPAGTRTAPPWWSTLRNTSKRTLAQVPVSIDVRDGAGKSLFSNDAPGLEPTLVKAPLLDAGQRLLWVNDQVDAGTAAADVEAAGRARRPPARRSGFRA